VAAFAHRRRGAARRGGKAGSLARRPERVKRKSAAAFAESSALSAAGAML